MIILQMLYIKTLEKSYKTFSNKRSYIVYLYTNTISASSNGAKREILNFVIKNYLKLIVVEQKKEFFTP